MLKKPRLKYCYRAQFLDDQNVLLLSEKKSTLISGKLFNLVLSNIQEDGTSLEELAARLEGKLSAAEIVYALNQLNKEGYITESSPSVSPGARAYWNAMDMDVNTLLERLENNPVSLTSIGSPSIEIFQEVFRTAGIKTGPGGALDIIITDRYERGEFDEINSRALASGQPWLLIKPEGVECWIGPVFVPGKTGCWECLRQRLSINRPFDAHPPILSMSPMSVRAAANLAAGEVVKWIYAGGKKNLEGKILSLDTVSLSTRWHVLVKRPQCPVCGETRYRTADADKPHELPPPVIFEKRAPYCITRQGGYREVPLEDTVEKYKHHVSNITGVVPTLEPYFPHQGSPLYNYYSGHNLALKSKTMLWLNRHARNGNLGKGKTKSQAEAGALCEAIERYSSTFQGDEPYIEDSLHHLGEKGIHPNVCMNFSQKQYRDRERANKECTRFNRMVPVPFDPSRTMSWTPVYSLTRRRFQYLPSCFCYSQYPARDEQRLFAYPDNNGSAAGNSLEEAILQGFLELVERDSVAIWWYNMPRRPGVDLYSFNEPYFNRLADFYRSLNRSLYVLDLTADLHIPTFAAVSHRLDHLKQDIIIAFGAHVDAKIAVERALLELNQFLPVVCFSREEKQSLHWLDTAVVQDHPYLVPLENVPLKKASDYPPLCPPNIYDSLMFCVDTVHGLGLETLVLDMTRPDVGLNVVRVFVPGLRHFWKRLAPGRLYDIPVKMGWLKTPLKEDQLNPVEIFI